MISSDTDVCTVISILPLRINEDKPLQPSNYTLDAVLDPEKEVSTLMVFRGSFRVYIDETRPAMIIPEPSDVIAQSICRDFKVASSHYSPGEAEPGLFYVRGGYKSEEVLTSPVIRPELLHYRRLQTEWFKRLIVTADDDWNKYHQRRMISDIQRIACKQLAIERPWDIDIEFNAAVKMTRCKFCRAEIHPDAIICMFCRGILNMEKYKTDFVSLDTVKTPTAKT